MELNQSECVWLLVDRISETGFWFYSVYANTDSNLMREMRDTTLVFDCHDQAMDSLMQFEEYVAPEDWQDVHGDIPLDERSSEYIDLHKHPQAYVPKQPTELRFE